MRRLALGFAVLLVTFMIGVAIDGIVALRHAAPQVRTYQPVVLEPKPILAPIVVSPPLPAATPAPYILVEYDYNKFVPDGMYSIAGTKPKDFEEFETIDLETVDFHGNHSAYISVSTSSDAASALFGLITENRVFFVTRLMKDGTAYRFDGQFVRKDFERVANTGKAVMRGTLTKMRNGRKVAERVVGLRLEYDRC